MGKLILVNSDGKLKQIKCNNCGELDMSCKAIRETLGENDINTTVFYWSGDGFGGLAMIYGNQEESIDKLNLFASHLTGHGIYGDVAIVALYTGDSEFGLFSLDDSQVEMILSLHDKGDWKI